jgi:alkanesulfonate monooxygenase SsuD/methylene tetrahydromethanopterin reductase-like flavin-dependent oxidoreductase (luciferase family)
MISFGVLFVQKRPVAELLDWAGRFDEAGVDSIWVADHLANPVDVDSFWLDGWTVLAAMAQRTTRCRIGPLVSNFVLHSPLQMARLTTTVDAISNGRVTLGLGMGHAAVCRSASSIFEPGPALADRFETGLTSLIKILDGKPLPLAQVPLPDGSPSPESVSLATPCVQDPRPPILVGGQGPRMIDIAARLGDLWNLAEPPGSDRGDPDEALRRVIERFEDRCAAHGRRGKVGRSILFDYAPGLTPRTRPELAELVIRMSRLGFDECIADAWPLIAGSTRSTEELLAFVAEDLPALREQSATQLR